MATLYIHGGMQKTGTTAIQHFLADNRELLAEQNAVFPDFSELFSHARIPKLHNGGWLIEKDLYTDSQPELYEKGFAYLGELAGQYDKIILTSEMLWNSGLCRPEFWTYLLEHLEPYDITVKVVLYLRRQDEFLHSLWAHDVKTAVDVPYKTFTFQQYIEEGYDKNQFLDYQKGLGTIENAIGRENMLIRIYEKGQYGGRDHTILSDFWETIGMPEDGPYKEQEKLKNISLRDSVLETKRYLNRLPGFTRDKGKKEKDVVKCLIAVQEQMQEEGLLKDRTGLTNAQRRHLMREFDECNAAVARRYFGREDGVLFYDRIPEAEEADETFTTEELIGVCGRVIVKLCEKNHSLHERKDEVRASNENCKKNLCVTKEKLREEKESNKQLRAQIAKQERQIRSMQHELDSSIFKLAAKKILKKELYTKEQ